MTIRGALVGCGFFARNHMHAWALIPEVEIVAVCDIDPARADAFAASFGATAYTDPRAMFAEARPALTDIATTVPSHRSLVELAARNGSAVICQKPFADTLEDARAMVDCCAAARVPLMVHENFRWQAPFRTIAARVAAGDIGTPTFLRLTFRHGFDVYAYQPYLAEVEDVALTDVGLHLFDLARFLMGDVERISCASRRLNPAVRGDDAFLAQLQHRNGGLTSVECSFFSQIAPDPFPQTLAWLEGTTGTLELASGYRLRLHRDGTATEWDVEPPVPAWGSKPWHAVQDSVLAFQRHVPAVLRGETEPQPSGAHNLQTLALAVAARGSARSGRTVTLDHPDGGGRP